jgi:peptidoglycan/LPS O-acetylase OafA/YrhL
MSDLNLFLSYSFFGRVFEFFVGIFMAILFKKSNLSHHMNFNFTYMGVLGIIVSVFLISLYADSQGLGIRKLNGKVINNFILPVIGIGPLFWGLLTEKTKLRSILETKIMIFLGKVSYVFYLIHIQLGRFEDNIIFVVIIGTAISALIYLLIEEPMNKIIRNKFHTAIKR